MTTPIQITIDHQPPAGERDNESRGAGHRVCAFDLVAATPWAIEPSMLDTIAAIARREGEGVEAVEARVGRPLQNARKVTMRSSVAVVPITGPIFRYANLMTEVSGATSIEVLARDFTTALDDPQVSSIVLDINSPGGQVTGIAEFAAMVNGATKPVVAYVDGVAASAAYWIAAAADEIVMAKSAMAGNVGAVLSLDTRKDPSKAEIVSSQSPNKRPDVCTDTGRAQLQSLVDAQAQVFIEDVAAYRNKTPESVVADWNGGAVLIARDAIAAGMADRIGTIEEVIAGLAGTRTKSPATPVMKGTAMNLDELRAAHPDLCAALVEEGRQTGLSAGATAERDRILAVEAQSIPGHEALIAQLKADGKTSGSEAAMQVLAAERAINASRHSELVAAAPKPVAHTPAPAPAPTVEADASKPVEERAKDRWDSDDKLRAEFRTLGAYTAYLKHHEAGRARVLGVK